MAVCPNCGYQSQGDPPVCVNCGARFRPYGVPYPEPVPANISPKKKSKTPYIILFSLLGVLVVMAVAACVMMLNSPRKHKKAPEYSCAQFTDEFNRVNADEEDAVQLDPEGWTVNEEQQSYEYNGDDFKIIAATDEPSNEDAKISSVAISPTTTKQGEQAATQSVMVFEEGKTQDEIEEDMKRLKNGETDKVVYDNTEITYDPETDSVVITPHGGESSDTNSDTEKSENAPVGDDIDNKPPEYSDFVSGNGFVKAGGKYIFSDGKTICYKTNIADSAQTVKDVNNTGWLLSNGETLYYAEKTDSGYAMCSVDIDGKNAKTLFTENEEIYPIHVVHKCLYYLKDSQTFIKYDLTDNTSSVIKDVSFSPNYYVVENDALYCSASWKSFQERNSVTVQYFNFDTEDHKVLISGCTATRFDYMPGNGHPHFNAYQFVDDSEAHYSEQYICTPVNGKLIKSEKLPDHSEAIAVSPASGVAVLCGRFNGAKEKRFYWWDPTTGKADLLLTETDDDIRVVAVCDTDYPDDIYLYGFTYDGTKGYEAKYFYKASKGILKAYELEDNATKVGILTIAHGYLVDKKMIPHKLTEKKESPTEPTAESTVEPSTASATEAYTVPSEQPTEKTSDRFEPNDYGEYVGTWKKDGMARSSKSVVITSVDGNKIVFCVRYVLAGGVKSVYTEEISATIVDGKADFTYTDNYGNTGSGTLELLDDHVRISISSNGENRLKCLSFEEDLYEYSVET